MRTSHTFTISLPAELAEQVDRLAAEEHRSRSELFREAIRRYIHAQRRWERILDLGPAVATRAGLDSEAAIEAAVDEAVREVRQRRGGA